MSRELHTTTTVADWIAVIDGRIEGRDGVWMG